MEVLSNLVSNLFVWAIKPICRQFGYMFYYSRNIENLRDGVKALGASGTRVGALVDEAKRRGNLIHGDVEKWLDDVSKLNKDVESVFNHQVRCLDLKSRFRMGKKAYKMKDRVDRLQNQGGNFTEDRVSYTAPPPPFSAIFSGDAVPIESRGSIMEKIVDALKKDDVKVLGLHGMGGVGKTTLIQEVAKRAETDKLFDAILMAVVSQDPSIRKIQDQFASKLGLSLGDDKESDTVRAGRLHEKLEKTAKVLVILDDLWKHLDLQAVGIPSPDKHKGCKIVITTRRKEVCAQMDCKNNTFSVTILSEDEGWHLFEKMAGDCVTSAEVKPFAIDVAKECGGLPLAIVVVARALKDQNPTRWNDALLELRASAPTNIEGVHNIVYPSLQLSYNYLDGEEIKHFFLLFSLFPEDEDIPIELQMRHGVGLGLFNQAGLRGTMKEAREKANFFVDKLKSACLLLDGDEEGTVRVHDVVRDVCLSSIASKEQPHNLNVYHQSHVFLVKSGSELTEWPEIDCTIDYTAISLVDNDINLFPCGLDFPKLKFLLFGGEEQELDIADSFFEKMKELKVLHIYGVQIPLFPPSQGLLGKLRTLCLEDCILEEMEMIGHLKGLEVLSLSGSEFEDNTLPNEISLLTRLRLLDLSNCLGLLIPCGILSNLSRLEELYLEGSFDEWEKESEEEFYIKNCGKKERYASISELKSSSHSLTTLMGMHVKDVTLFSKDLFFPNLTTFRIEIGDDLIYDENYSLSKAGLMVDFKGSSIAKDHGIWSLMRRCDYLRLSQMGNMKRILSDFNRDLKFLVVEKSDNIEEIIISEEGEAEFHRLRCLRLDSLPKLARFCNVRQSKMPIQSQSLFTDKVLFPCLEELALEDLHEVENIWHLELPNESFQQLKELKVTNCKKVSKIIPACMHPRLPKLQSLKVEMCASVEEVFGQQDLSTATGGGLDLYPHLTSLRLTGLSKLTHAPLNAFLNLDSLTDLFIKSCNTLTGLFQPSIAKRLVTLEKLEVRSCEEIQEIVGEEEEETEKVIVFPKVKSLWLHDLPKFTSFRKGDYKLKWRKCQNEASKNSGGKTEPITPTSRNNLGCPRFQPVFNHKVLFPCLEELALEDLHEVENIWHPELPNESFQQLKELKVTNCKKVSKIIPACMHPRLPKLQSLKVEMCASVEEVFERQDLSTATGGGLDLYSHSTSLRLTGLSKLTYDPLNAFLNLDSLTDLYIKSCNSLTSLFKSSVVKRLVNLEKLVVRSCEEIQEIVGEEEEEEETEKVIVFPMVKSLWLHDLPKLTSSRKGDFKLKWQKCQNEASKNSGDEREPIAPRSRNNLGCLHFQPIFNHKVLFPCLEELALEDLLEVENIWHPKFPNESFLQLKKLKVTNCKKVSKIIPACMHPRLPKLQSLKVEMCASVEEVFEQQDLSTATGGGLDLYPHLTYLRLTELSKLTHAPLNAFLNLDNLTDLSIKSCNSLTSLFQPSIAKRLVNLEDLTVSFCSVIQEIVGEEEEEEETEKVIVFPKVKSLWLHDLPELTSFRDGDYKLKWQKCQNEASKNDGGETEPIAPTSRNNLGCPSFQPLFNHKVTFPSLTMMRLSRLKGIKQIWGSQFPMESFPKLRELFLVGCGALEVVIGKQGGEEEIISGGNLVFPQLKTLDLQDLRNIRCFSESNLYTLEFPSLDEMTLFDCPKMTTFSYTSATTPKLEQIFVEGMFGGRTRAEHIPMTKDINTVAKDIFLPQGQVNRSTSEEKEVEEMVRTSEEEDVCTQK